MKFVKPSVTLHERAYFPSIIVLCRCTPMRKVRDASSTQFSLCHGGDGARVGGGMVREGCNGRGRGMESAESGCARPVQSKRAAAMAESHVTFAAASSAEAAMTRRTLPLTSIRMLGAGARSLDVCPLCTSWQPRCCRRRRIA